MYIYQKPIQVCVTYQIQKQKVDLQIYDSPLFIQEIWLKVNESNHHPITKAIRRESVWKESKKVTMHAMCMSIFAMNCDNVFQPKGGGIDP